MADALLASDPVLDAYFARADPEQWASLEAAIAAAACDGAAKLSLDCGPSLESVPSTLGGALQLRELQLYGPALLTLPPQIGNLRRLAHLATYGSRLLCFPCELTRCASLPSVGGSVLYIDLSSLLGRVRFPPLAPLAAAAVAAPQRRRHHRTSPLSAARHRAMAAALPAVPPELVAVMADYDDDAAFACSACSARVPYAAPSPCALWLQRQWQGDRRALLPLLARCCSERCAAALQARYPPPRPADVDASRNMCDTENRALSLPAHGAARIGASPKEERLVALLRFLLGADAPGE